MSKGEYILGQLLRELFPSQTVQSQVPIKVGGPGCRKTLYLDYYIPGLRLAFEYNGRQHTEFVPHFHKSKLSRRYGVRADYAKATYCADAGITLIYITYSDFPAKEKETNIRFLKNAIKEATEKASRAD